MPARVVTRSHSAPEANYRPVIPQRLRTESHAPRGNEHPPISAHMRYQIAGTALGCTIERPSFSVSHLASIVPCMLPSQDDAHTQRLRGVRDQVEGLRRRVEAQPDEQYLRDRLEVMEQELADLERG